MKYGKRKSLESFYIREDTNLQSAKLNAIPDAIMALQDAITNMVEDDVVEALNKTSNLARGSADIRGNLRDTSASKLIASILHLFINSIKVCEAGLQAMCLLIKDEEGAIASIHENIDAFTSPDTCIDIVSILSTHREKENITAGVFIAIDIIAHTETNRTLLQHAGVCNILVEVVQSPMSTADSEVLTLGLKAAGTLMTNHVINKKSFVEAGLPEVAVSIGKRSLVDVPVLVFVARTLLYMSSIPDESIRAHLRDIESCELVLSVMKTNIAHSSLCDLGCQFIANMAHNNNANKARFIDNGVCRLVTELFSMHGRVPSLIAHLMSAVTSLCTRNMQCKTALGDMGVCESVIEVLDSFSKVPATAPAMIAGCLRAVSALAGADRNKARFARIIPIVTALMQSCSGEEAVVEKCCLVLAFLHPLFSVGEEESITFPEVASELFGALTKHAESAPVTEQALGAVVNLSLFAPNAECLGQAGVCAQIPAALVRFKDAESVVSHAFKASLNLCVASESCARRVSDSKVALEVIECLRHNVVKEAVVELGCRLVLIMMMNHEKLFLGQLAAAGICEIVVDILSEHTSCSSIVDMSFQILAFLGRHRVLAEKVVNAHALGYVVVAASEHSHDVSIVENACLAVGALSFHSHADRANAGEAGICELLVEVLELHADDPLITEHCCCAIRNLCDVKDNIERFASIPSTYETINRILQIHGDSVAVLSQCAFAIAALTFDNDETIKTFGAMGACELLMDVIHKHPAERPIVDAILIAAVNLSAKASNTKKMMDLHAYAEVVDATRGRLEEPSTAEQALKILLNLALLAEENVPQLGAGGACEYVQDALDLHVGEEPVAALALKTMIALTTGSRGDSNGARFMKSKVCELLVKCMKAYKERYRLSELVCRAIVAISCSENENAQARQSRFGQVGACEALSDIIRTHVSHVKVVDACCKVVCCLGLDHEVNVASLYESGTPQLINRCLLKYTEDAPICENILRAIEVMALDPRVCSSFAKGGVPDLIQIVLEKHSGIESATVQIFKTVTRMVSCNDECVAKFCGFQLEAVVVEQMIKHTHSGLVAATACSLTGVMCAKDIGCVIRFVNAGMCEQLVDSLTDFCDDAVVAKAVFSVVPTLFMDTETLERAFDNGICDGISDALTANLEVDAELAEEALQVIIILCKDSKACCERLVNKGLCEDVVTILRCHVKDEHHDEDGSPLLSQVCTLVELVCESLPSSCAKFAASGLANELLTLPGSLFDDPLAVAACFRMATAACRNSPENIHAFDAAGICEVVAEALQRFCDHREASEAGCQISLELVQDETTRDKLVQLELCRLLVNLVRVHPDHNTVAEVSLRCIASVPPSIDPFLQSSSAGASTVMEVAIQVLEADVTAVGPTVQALRVLSSIISVDSNKEYFVASIEQGSCSVCKAVYKRMAKFSTSVEVCRTVLDVVLSLSETAALKQKWINLGICESIVDSLRTHSLSAELSIASFDVVQLFSKDRVGSSKFASSLCECFLEALKVHVNTEVVVEHSLAALCALVQSPEGPTFVVKFGAAGACELTAYMLKVHSKKESIAVLCCQALYLLCSNHDGNRAKTFEACDPLVSAMKKHCKTSVHMAENGCRAIVALSQHDANRSRLGSNACLQVVEAIKKYMDNASVAEYSCVAIKNLTYKNEENKATLHQVNINELLVQVMKRHKSDKTINEKAGVALQIFIEG